MRFNSPSPCWNRSFSTAVIIPQLSEDRSTHAFFAHRMQWLQLGVDRHDTTPSTRSIGKLNGLFQRPPRHPVLGSARTPRASGWPALDDADRPPVRPAGLWGRRGCAAGAARPGGLIQSEARGLLKKGGP